MNKQHIYKVGGMTCHSCELLIKEKLSTLPEIKYIEVSYHRGEVLIDYAGDRPDPEKLNDIFKEEKFIFSDDKSQGSENIPTASPSRIHDADKIGIGIKEHIYKVEGMHCASCEILIEKKLLELQNIESVDASTSKSEVVVEYQGDRPNPERLTKMFKEENYRFSDTKSDGLNAANKGTVSKEKIANPTLVAFNIAIFIIVAFLFLNKMGFSGLLNVNSKSSLPAFFFLGALAGISSCAALVGGMILSMSKQWQQLYSEESTTYRKLQPHLMFNAGRIVSYTLLGAVLGMIGSRLQVSFQFTSFLVVAISLLMIGLALQMLGVKAFRKFQFTLPKFVTKYIADEKNFQGKHMPFTMGALTFFLPCGFTITAQGLALLSGSGLQGSLIMLAFALGTAPMLLLIGLSAVKMFSKPHLAEKFSKVAGFLVLFFALFNINSQMNVLGFSGISTIFQQNQTQTVVDEKDLPPVINGKQVVKMNASASGYSPNYLKVRAGVPVRWEITDTGTSGCTNAIISKSLFDGSIDLTPGNVSVKEFTPTKAGKYRFSCWMGMVTGVIEVVDTKNVNSSNPSKNIVIAAEESVVPKSTSVTNDDVIPSGVSGCGCGGGAVAPNGGGSGSCH